MTKRTGESTKLALMHLKTAVKIDPSFSRAYNTLGNIYRKKKKINKSIEYYKKAISFGDGGYGIASLNLAYALFDCDMLKEGFNSVMKVVKVFQQGGDGDNLE